VEVLEVKLGQIDISHDEPITKAQFQAIQDAFEQAINARVGKWAIAILGTVVGGVVIGLSAWYGVLNRVEKLETWKNERVIGIDQYNEFRRELEGRLGRIEGQQDEILRLLKEGK
jgi:hypothetical protein